MSYWNFRVEVIAFSGDTIFVLTLSHLRGIQFSCWSYRIFGDVHYRVKVIASSGEKSYRVEVTAYSKSCWRHRFVVGNITWWRHRFVVVGNISRWRYRIVKWNVFVIGGFHFSSSVWSSNIFEVATLLKSNAKRTTFL